MLFNLLVLFILVPLVELALLLLLAQHTDPFFTFAVVIVTGVVGTFLARSQGWHTYQKIQGEVRRGQLPTTALLDAAMIFAAGALLLTPGLLTDAFGITLLIPFFRRRYRNWAARQIRHHFQVVSFTTRDQQQKSRIIDSHVTDRSNDPASSAEDDQDSSQLP